MTTRLYYTDAELGAFDARVESCTPAETGADVVLDRTAFYPTSGGQPFDTGRLGDAAVLDVSDRDDGAVVHRVSAAIQPGRTVRGTIDWPRRLDHMQQHTGQHILSAAFDRTCGVRTESFHMGPAVSTIDLAREVSADEIAGAEAAANGVVWADRPVGVQFVTEEQARSLPLRKPPARSGPLRLVEIPDFDLSACGGTHVARTGVVGIVAVSAWERFKGASRISFVCGGRALRSHMALRDTVLAAARVLSVQPHEVADRVARLAHEARHNERTLADLEIALARYRGVELRRLVEAIGPYAVVISEDPNEAAAMLKVLAQSVVSQSGLVSVLLGGGEPVPVVLARSADVDLDVAALTRELTGALGGRGGGRPDVSQCGVPAPSGEIVKFLRKALAERSR